MILMIFQNKYGRAVTVGMYATCSFFQKRSILWLLYHTAKCDRPNPGFLSLPKDTRMTYESIWKQGRERVQCMERNSRREALSQM